MHYVVSVLAAVLLVGTVGSVTFGGWGPCGPNPCPVFAPGDTYAFTHSALMFMAENAIGVAETRLACFENV